MSDSCALSDPAYKERLLTGAHRIVEGCAMEKTPAEKLVRHRQAGSRAGFPRMPAQPTQVLSTRISPRAVAKFA